MSWRASAVSCEKIPVRSDQSQSASRSSCSPAGKYTMRWTPRSIRLTLPALRCLSRSLGRLRSREVTLLRERRVEEPIAAGPRCACRHRHETKLLVKLRASDTCPLNGTLNESTSAGFGARPSVDESARRQTLGTHLVVDALCRAADVADQPKFSRSRSRGSPQLIELGSRRQTHLLSDDWHCEILRPRGSQPWSAATRPSASPIVSRSRTAAALLFASSVACAYRIVIWIDA